MENKKVPKDWKIVKLGEVVEYIKEKIHDREEWKVDRYIGGQHFDEGEIRITKSAPIEGNELVIGSAFHMKFKPGQVLYVTRNPRLRKGGMVNFEGVCSNVTFTLESKKEKLIQELLPFIIQTENFTRHACASAHGSTNPFLNWKDIASYDLLLPSISEQKKIAEVLWGVEENIKSLNNFIENLTRLKEKILFKLISDPKSSKLKIIDFCYVKGRIGWKGLKKSEFTTEGPYLITGTDFCEEGINWDTCYHITEERYDESPEIIVKNGDILVTKDGTIGKVTIVEGLKGKASLNSHLLLVRPDNKKVLDKFLYYALKSKLFRSFIDQQKTGTTLAGLNQRKFEQFSIPAPDIREQERIIKRIDAVTNSLRNAQNNFKSLKDLRQKLMNELLLGNLRLK
jgi:type I restriction enzyme, S subunit